MSIRCNRIAVGECPICARGAPLDVIAELEATWVTAEEEASLPGYVCVVSKHHVVEPFELPAPELDAFWREAMLVARAVHRLLAPAKLNYEIHGNTIPHLHMHVYPRFRGDPYESGPIDPRRTSFRRSAGELARLGEAIAASASSTTEGEAPPVENYRVARVAEPASRALRRRIAFVCSCETRDSVTPSTSPISRRVNSS